MCTPGRLIISIRNIWSGWQFCPDRKKMCSPFMNDVMRIVKEEEPEMLEQSYDMDCRMTLRIRKSAMPKLRARLEKVETLRFEEA